jgi:polar amino acid transport system substrate-binding protein
MSCKKSKIISGFSTAILLSVIFLSLFPVAASSADEKVIIVGGNKDYPPYEFIDEDGKAAGYNVDLTKAIANIMGMKVEFRLGNWRDVRNALDSGEVDMLQGMSFSEGRSKVVDFSIPHTLINHSIYTRRGLPRLTSFKSLEGKEVAFHNLGFIYDYVNEQKIKVIPVLSDTPAGALELVAAGKPDYAIVASLPAAYIINEKHLDTIVPSAKSIVSVKYGFAVKKGNADLLARINEGLAILKQTGQYQKIYDKWLGILEPSGVQWTRIIKYGSIITVIFIFILAGSLLWSWMLKKQVAIRTAALEQEVFERKKAVEELRLRQLQLVQADKMASLGILVSGVAHEINNPNALILLNLPLLSDYVAETQPIVEDYYRSHGDFSVAGLQYSQLQNKIQTKLADVQNSAKKIKRIVDDLKGFARTESPEFTEVVDINAVAQAAIRLADGAIRKATNYFTVILGQDLPQIRGSAQRIEQVLVNLILNACQALRNPNEGIYLATRFDAVRAELICEVRDEGEGISPEDIPHVADPFFTTKRQQGGTGLGLSVSASIVKEHNGILEFVSDAGKGTVVTLRFPVNTDRVTV